VLVWRNPSWRSVFCLAQMVAWTPQLYAQSTPLDELMIMVLPVFEISLDF